jgi:hypothetical protein
MLDMQYLTSYVIKEDSRDKEPGAKVHSNLMFLGSDSRICRKNKVPSEESLREHCVYNIFTRELQTREGTYCIKSHP